MTREKYIVPTYTRCWFAGAIACMINEGKGIHEIANTLKAHPQLIEAFIFDAELKERCRKQSDAFLEDLLLSVNDKDFFKRQFALGLSYAATYKKFFFVKNYAKTLATWCKKNNDGEEIFDAWIAGLPTTTGDAEAPNDFFFILKPADLLLLVQEY